MMSDVPYDAGMPYDPRDSEPDHGDWECPICKVRFRVEDDKLPLVDLLLMHGWGCPERMKAQEYLGMPRDDSPESSSS
jgi:hypothetical protein